MKFKRTLIWFYMLSKRLLCRISFVLLLLAIPIMVYGANVSMQGESGVLKIILCASPENEGANELIENIISEKSIMLFEKQEDLDKSLKLLNRKKADAVWHFAEDFDGRVSLYAGGKSSKPFVTVYEREDNVPLKLSREKLFGEVYNKFSYYVYRDFIYSEITDPQSVPEAAAKRYYDETLRRDNIVQIKTVDGGEVSADKNYLSSPLRGMLSVLIVICGFAGAMYYLKDKENGKYDWLNGEKRIIPAFAQCMASVMLSSAAVFAAIFASGTGAELWKELISMALFTLAACGFCLCFAVIFKTSAALGAGIPAFMVLMMVLSPIFFNVRVLKPIRLMLPTHYYLYSVYDTSFIIYFVYYIFSVYAVAFVLNKIVNK